MNFQTTSIQSRNSGFARTAALPGVARRERRARDFGVGYGSSSGYAARDRYAPNLAAARFRVA